MRCSVCLQSHALARFKLCRSVQTHQHALKLIAPWGADQVADTTPGAHDESAEEEDLDDLNDPDEVDFVSASYRKPLGQPLSITCNGIHGLYTSTAERDVHCLACF